MQETISQDELADRVMKINNEALCNLSIGNGLSVLVLSVLLFTEKAAEQMVSEKDKPEGITEYDVQIMLMERLIAELKYKQKRNFDAFDAFSERKI